MNRRHMIRSGWSLCVAVAVVSMFHSDAVAQQLAIAGRVTGSDGRALIRAQASLDAFRISALTDFEGRYSIEIPDTVAQGQSTVLVFRLPGHERVSIPVTLSGGSIVRDVVMPIRASSNAELSYGILDRVDAGKDLTIAGQIVDTAGASIQTVQVNIDSTAWASLTDTEGRYSFVVPAARLSGERRRLLVRQIGYGPVNDTIALVPGTLVADFVLSRPIYSGLAKDALASDGDVDGAAGLSNLAKEPHRKGEREIRVRVYGGLIMPYVMYRFFERSGKAGGEVIAYWPSRSHGEHDGAQSPARGYPGTSCKWKQHGIATCRVRFAHTPDWRRMWKTLDSLDVWAIRDEGPLRKRLRPVFDGESIAGESWDGRDYNAWAYASGAQDSEPGRAKVTAVSSMLREINSFMGP